MRCAPSAAALHSPSLSTTSCRPHSLHGTGISFTSLSSAHVSQVLLCCAVLRSGTGAFGLPFGVVQAGTLLSFACIAGFTCISAICLCYVLESMARAGGIMQAERGKAGSARIGLTSGYAARETDALLSAASVPGHYVPHIGYDKIDFSLMCELFGGRSGHALVHLCMTLYSYGVLWAYAAVFSSSVDAIFFRYALQQDCNIYLSPSPACQWGYVVCVLVFAVIVTWLSLQDVGDQAAVQKLLTAYRFAAFFTMIVTCCIAFTVSPNQFDPEAGDSVPTIATLPLVRWSGFGLIFCTTAVALDVHWNIPDVLLPLRDKAAARRIALSALLCAALFYTLIALVCAAEFGSSTLPLATLNWSSYSGLAGGWGAGSPSGWSRAVQLFVILFPVCNQCSVYPLVVLTLGDNYYSLLPAAYRETYSPLSLRRACRLAACLPPIAFALCFGKLDTIFTITGLFAFALEFIVPCLLQLASMRMVQAKYGAGCERTQYSSWASDSRVVCVVLVLGCAAFLVSIISTALGVGEVSA